MPPQQQPQGHYDFIMNAGQQPKRSIFPGGNSPLQRYAIVIGGIGILIILVIVVFSSLFSSGDGNKEVLLKVAQQQSELTRVAEFSLAESTPPARGIAISTSFAMRSDQRKLLAVLGQNGVKFGDKQLTLLKDRATDERIKNAKAAANYDATLVDVLDEQLTAYQATVKQAYNNSKNPAVKEVLAQNFESAGLLLKQIDSSGL